MATLIVAIFFHIMCTPTALPFSPSVTLSRGLAVQEVPKDNTWMEVICSRGKVVLWGTMAPTTTTHHGDSQ
jgi:hypothetical protein